MKIACFGDYHAHLFTEFSEVDEVTGNSRFTQILAVLDYMREYCKNNGIRKVLFAGDMFHKRVTVNTLVYNAVFERIKRFRDDYIEIVMTVGNHDQVDNSDFPEHSLKPFKELSMVTVLDTFETYTLREVRHDKAEEGELVPPTDYATIFSAPYSKNAEMVKEKLNEYADSIKRNPKLIHNPILLGHLGISGAFVGKGSYAMSDSFTVEDLHPEAFKFGVFGHFHKRQFLGGHKHFFYTGAPIQHSFNDEGEDKGFYILDTDTGEVAFEAIPTPKFVTIKVHAMTDGLIDLLEEDVKSNFIRFQVNADVVEGLVEGLPEDSKYRLEVQKEYTEDKRADVDFSMAFSEVITNYAKKFNPDAEQAGLEIYREAVSK